jgi:diguanylate cyclase (GGDEF)-like protein
LSARPFSGIDNILHQDEFTDEELQCLREVVSVAQVVVSSLDLDEVLQNILCSALGIMDIPAGSIALYDEIHDQLELHAHIGLSERLTATKSWAVTPGGLTDRILSEGQLFVVEDIQGEAFFNNPLAVSEGIRALIAVPLKIQDKIVGILYLDDFVPRTFSTMRLHMLSILASFATMSIDNARLHIKTRLLACTDGLTGLFNHRHFLLSYEEEMARALRYKKPMSLVMIDVDDFKRFNDRYGHPAGDKALIALAKSLQELLRNCDFSFRYGGEEFIAILTETDLDKAIIAAERLRLGIAQGTRDALKAIAPEGITVSIGVASFPRDGSGDLLIKEADDQLYRAKREGKNCVYFREVKDSHGC